MTMCENARICYGNKFSMSAAVYDLEAALLKAVSR